MTGKNTYSITRDVEAPYLSFLAETEYDELDGSFSLRWAWSDEGRPPEGAYFWATPEEAQAQLEESCEGRDLTDPSEFFYEATVVGFNSVGEILP